MNKISINKKLAVILLLLSCSTLFGEVVLDTIAKFVPENKTLLQDVLTSNTVYQFNNFLTHSGYDPNDANTVIPLSQTPDFNQVTVFAFTGYPVHIDSISEKTDSIKIYYSLPDYNGDYQSDYRLPPRAIDEVKICTMPKTTKTLTFIHNTLLMDAAPPVFTDPILNSRYNVGDPTTSMSSNAKVYDGGTLSYQWYSNTTQSNAGGTAIDGETNSYFSPPSDAAGTFYYYVVVTNTNNAVSGNKTATVASDVGIITIINPNSILTPNREIPATGSKEPTALFPKAEELLTVGPNPVAESAGKVSILWSGKEISGGNLRLFDASGNLTAKIRVSGSGEIGSWNLKNRKGTEAAEGTYLLKGTMTAKDGSKIKVSRLVGVK